MNEDKIRQLGEDIPIPESLSPEKIKEKLEKLPAPAHKKNRKRVLAIRIAATAACFVLLLTGGSYLFASGILTFHPDALKNRDTQSKNGSSPESATISDTQTPTPQTTYAKCKEVIQASYNSFSMKEFSLNENAVAETENYTDSVSSGSSQAAGTKKYASSNYTRTNTQVDGVDEGDIVKTDGRYIYTCSEDAMGTRIQIVQANGEQTDMAGSFTIENFSVNELYLSEGTLTAIGSSWSKHSSATENTCIYVYDVSDPANPKERNCQTQSGVYQSSRQTGNFIYTISLMYVDYDTLNKKGRKYIPRLNDKIIPEESLYCPEEIESSSTFLVITSLDLTKSENYKDSLSLLGEGGIYYVSENHIYTAASSGSFDQTVISKFSYQEGGLKSLASTTIKGRLLNQFSMDEYQGCLRFVATTYHHSGETSNGLYILDENLKSVGSVTNLARSERIYSARFMGEKAYFVTYRETDPLFYVDLSDPQNPEVKDKLKIPGFSEYLHPYGEDLLLGIGLDTGSDGDQRVKLSMFDISSPTDIKEHDKTFLPDSTYSLAGTEHKGFLVDYDRNRIGFGSSCYEDNVDTTYYIYSYTKKGFKRIAALSPPGLSLYSTRGLYIGDYLYLVDGTGAYGVYVYNADSLEQVKNVKF